VVHRLRIHQREAQTVLRMLSQLRLPEILGGTIATTVIEATMT
jgi:hypothetical protein